MQLTNSQLAELTQAVSKTKRIVGQNTYIDYFGMFDGQMLICILTHIGDMKRVTCTLDEFDVSQQVQEWFEKNLFNN